VNARNADYANALNAAKFQVLTVRDRVRGGAVHVIVKLNLLPMQRD